MQEGASLMRRPKILALLLGAMGAGGAMFASAPAQASVPDGRYTAHQEEMAFHSASQSRTIEALEDFLYKASQGSGKSSPWWQRAVYELAKFECTAGPGNKGAGCAPDGSALGHDGQNGNRYGG